MRMQQPAPQATSTSSSPSKIADVMPAVGSDQQRGGWYDVIERDAAAGRGRATASPGTTARRGGSRSRRILAYLILPGILGDAGVPASRRASPRRSTTPSSSTTTTARVYFNVLANGMPYLLGTERLQGQPLDERLPLDRAVLPGGGLHQPADHQAAAGPALQAARRARSRTTSCASRPTSCRPASIKIDEVWIDGQPYADFDADKLTVKLPPPAAKTAP